MKFPIKLSVASSILSVYTVELLISFNLLTGKSKQVIIQAYVTTAEVRQGALIPFISSHLQLFIGEKTKTVLMK